MSSSAGLLPSKAKVVHPLFKDRLNFVPLPYRGVSVQAYDGPMTEEGIVGSFLGRETYRRTEFIVLRAPDGGHAVIAVDACDREPLFAPIAHVEVLALPDACYYVRAPETDCANRSALAALAKRHGVGRDQTLICEGKYDHVNFLHHPSLHFDQSRAFAALSDRSACATDLVERLMATTGADYRAAHGVVGGPIRALEENGRSLADASVGDLGDALRGAGLPSAGVTEQLLASALDLAACVASRTDVGGAAPEEVEAMAEALTAAAAAGGSRRCFQQSRAG